MTRSIVVFLILLLGVPGVSVADNNVTVAARAVSPLNAITKPVVEEAYRRIGLNVEFVHFAGNRSIIEANAGKTDGEVSRLRFVLKKFTNLRIVPAPLFSSDLVAITNDPRIEISDWKSLSPYKTVAPESFRLVWNRLKSHNDAHKVSNTLEALGRLLNDQAKVAVVNRYEADRMMVVFQFSNPMIKTSLLESHPIYHFVHKKNEHLVPGLTRALEEMTRDGTLERIWLENGASPQ
ncbi:MAG: transporter substrate-binding domain-containing protein [Sedimenticola sp.]